MDREILIKTSDGTPFLADEGGVTLTAYNFNAPRMGIPQLTATVMYGRCLDDEWTGEEYVEFKGEKYLLIDTPSSSKENTDERYKHELIFKSEREALAHAFFYDVVPSWAATYDKPNSNSTEFVFYGTPQEFVDRLNCALRYSNLGDSILQTKTTLTLNDIPVGDGYCAVLDTAGGYDLEQSQEFSLSDTYIWDAMAEAFNIYEIPFEFKGKQIIWGAKKRVVEHKFEYGYDNELLSVAKNNANAKLINRVTFKGSEENIPYYYPNESEYGHISVNASTTNKYLTADKIEIANMSLLLAYAKPDTPIVYYYERRNLLTGIDIIDMRYSHQGLEPWLDYSFSEWVGAESTSQDLELKISVNAVNEYVISSIVGGVWMKNSSSPGGFSELLNNSAVFGGVNLYKEVSPNYEPLNVKVLEDGTISLGQLEIGMYKLVIHIKTNHPTGLDIQAWAIGNVLFRTTDTDLSYWMCAGVKKNTLADFGLRYNAVIPTMASGDSFFWSASSRMPFQKNLMPPIYIDTLGEERFYDAINNMYQKEDGTYYTFSHPLRFGTLAPKVSANITLETESFKPEQIINNRYGDIISLRSAFESSAKNAVSSYYPQGYPFEDGIELTHYVELRSTRPSKAYPYGEVQTEGATSVILTIKKPLWLYIHARIGVGKNLTIYNRDLNEINGAVVYDVVDDNSTSNAFVTTKWELDTGEYLLTEIGGTGRLAGFSYELKEPSKRLLAVPHEHIHVNENIKPTIKGITNTKGQLFGEIAGIAFDDNDNDSLKPDVESTESKDALNYEHSFFYIKLNIFDGPDGFNLFKHAIQNDAMTLQITSGSCNGCKFKVQAFEQEINGATEYFNPVQTKEADGDIVDGGYSAKVTENVAGLQEWQQDTSKNSVWICVQKDASTFGVIMPNRSNNYFPSVGDTFNITHIDLPESYKRAAERKGMHEALQVMEDNNDEKFTFDIKASRIFFAENPDVLTQIDEYAMLRVIYNDKEWVQFINSIEISYSENEVLPDVKVTLVEEIAAGETFQQNIINQVQGMAQGSGVIVGGGVTSGLSLSEGDKRYLRKDVADRSVERISTDKAFEVGEFVSGLVGGIFDIDPETGRTRIETDYLKVRLKAIYETLEIVKVSTIGGKQMITPGGGMTISFVEEFGDVYRCYFKQQEDGTEIKSRFVVEDMAIAQEYNLLDNTNRHYWRKVVAVNNEGAYIDLSKSDCEKGSDAPAIGDSICHLGNKKDPTRQSAIIHSTEDEFAPCVTLYHGINDYSLVNMEYVAYGVNKSDKNNPRAFFRVYGDAYVGNRDRTSYMEYTPENGLEVRGKISSKSTIDGKNIDDYIQDKASADIYTLDIDNEVVAFACNINGAYTGAPIITQARVYKGTQQITTGVVFDIVDKTNLDSSINNTGRISINDIYADTAILTISATVDGVTLTASVSCYKVKPGANGESPSVFSLVPSVDNITRSATGQLSVDKISCAVLKTTGASQEYTNQKKLTYQILPNGVETVLAHPSGSSIAISIPANATAIVFTLTETNNPDIVLDRERVPVLDDASDFESGGVNILRNTSFFSSDYWSFHPNTSIDTTKRFNGNNSVLINYNGTENVNTYYGIRQYLSLNPALAVNPGEYFVASVWAYCEDISSIDNGANIEIDFVSKDNIQISAVGFSPIPSKSGVWERKYLLFKTPVDTASLRLYAYLMHNGKIWLSEPQIERGTNLSDWSASPEDFMYLTEALKNSGSIEGGLILGSMIQLGYENEKGERVVTAGMNGIQQNGGSGKEIAFWSGGEMADLGDKNINEGATFLIRHDGTAYAANNTVRFGQSQVDVGANLHLSDEGMRLQDEDEVKVLISNQEVKADFDAFRPAYFNAKADFSITYTMGYVGLRPVILDIQPPGNTTIFIKRLTPNTTVNISFKQSFTQRFKHPNENPPALGSFYQAVIKKNNAIWKTVDVPATVVATEFTSQQDNINKDFVRVFNIDYQMSFITPDEGKNEDLYSLEIVYPDTDPNAHVIYGEFKTIINAGTGTNSITASGMAVGSNQTLLGSNGLSSVWANSVFAINNEAIILRVGKQGIKITESGLSWTNNGGSSWSPFKE